MDSRQKFLESGDSSDADAEGQIPEREVWSHKIEYLLSLVGYSVGLGNIWRFPYMCVRNGGGAFMIPFTFFLLMCGIPLYFLEVCLGQFSGKSALVVWSSVSPIFKGLGFLMITISGIVSWYYNTIIAWVIYYLLNSFYPKIPWATCDNWWNTDRCIISRTEGRNMTSHNGTSHAPYGFIDLSINRTNLTSYVSNLYGNNSQSNLNLTEEKHLQTAALEFWKYNVLRKSEGIDHVGGIQHHLALSLLGAWVFTGLCLIKGIKSVGKVVYVTVLLPYVLLTVFLIRGLTLDGAIDGIIHYVNPDFTRLFSIQIWVEAALQVFYSLGPAWGSLITMSSYNKFNNKCLKDAVVGTLADGLSSVYAGFVVFAILGFMSKETGLPLEEVADAGPGLVFVAYPEAIMKLPLPHLWGVMFFIMLLTVGIDSQFGMFETVSSGLVDSFPRQLSKCKLLLTFSLCGVLFLMSLPFATNAGIYMFQLVDWYASAFCILLGSMLECVVISWVYGAERFSRDIKMMTGRPVPMLIRFGWCYITPLIMIVVLVYSVLMYGPPNSAEYTYPEYTQAVGTVIAFLPIIPVPIFMALKMFSTKGTGRKWIKKCAQPDQEWGPGDRKHHKEYEPYSYHGGILMFLKINTLGDRSG